MSELRDVRQLMGNRQTITRDIMQTCDGRYAVSVCSEGFGDDDITWIIE
jgi:hypothetical protein